LFDEDKVPSFIATRSNGYSTLLFNEDKVSAFTANPLLMGIPIYLPVEELKFFLA